MFNHISKNTRIIHYRYRQVRNKITVSKLNASETAQVQRPTPVLLLRTEESNEWSNLMQKEFSRLGYFTVDAAITLPEKKKNDQLLLQTCYQELNQATLDLSFFPPLLVSYGEIAIRISQKYVSNKPVSGLVMIEQLNEQELCSDKEDEFPISEFEPRFPLFMISNKQPPEFLDGWIDYVELKHGNEFKDLTQWMDDIGM